MIPRGYFYLISCAFSFGLITTLAKISYDEGATPHTVVFFRILSASILMGLWSFWTGSKIQSGKKKQGTCCPQITFTIKNCSNWNLYFSNESGIFRFCKVFSCKSKCFTFFYISILGFNH